MTFERPRQLPLDLPSRPALGRGALFVAPCNADAVATIDAWRNWPAGKLVLVGEAGSGKTHLAQVWAAASGARVVSAADLAGADLPGLADCPVAVEDADRAAGNAAAERALLHLHNLSAAGAGALLLTARVPPASWRLALPDLASRMQAAATVRIARPDDVALRAVLIKLFADRQLAPSPAALHLILTRMERSFAAARDIVARLDSAALAERRAVTRTLAARLLDEPARSP